MAKEFTFNSAGNLAGREDYLFTLEYLQKYSTISKINIPLLFYRKHAGQISGNKLLMLRRQIEVLRFHYTETNRSFIWLRAAFNASLHVVLAVYYRVMLRRL